MRTLALPPFAVALLRRRRQERVESDLDAVFATRRGTWHQVTDVERRWREVRAGTGFEWVTPHTFRKAVASHIAQRVDSDTASQQLGHSSPAITREFYISKPAIVADVASVLQELTDEP